MSRALAESPSTPDAFSNGDSAIFHDQASAQPYREAAQEAAQRGPGRMIASKQPAARAEALPSPGVSRQVANKEIGRLRASAEAGRRDLQGRFVFNANGTQVSDPVQIEMRVRLAADVEAADTEANRLSQLDDGAVQVWAFSRGVR